MNVKQDVGYINLDEVHYDIFDGGYISPDILDSPEDADRVFRAIEIIEEFISTIEDHNDNVSFDGDEDCDEDEVGDYDDE